MGALAGAWKGQAWIGQQSGEQNILSKIDQLIKIVELSLYIYIYGPVHSLYFMRCEFVKSGIKYLWEDKSGARLVRDLNAKSNILAY